MAAGVSLRLVLIRHAKSSWAEPGLADSDRPLNGRGQRSATLIGRWLNGQRFGIARALVSPSARTRETWTRITAETGSVPTQIVPELYESEAETMLAVLKAVPEVAVLAMVGHNPAIGEFARRLLAGPPDEPDFAKFPTGATAVIDFDARQWAEIGWGAGRLADFVVPRRLEAKGQ